MYLYIIIYIYIYMYINTFSLKIRYSVSASTRCDLMGLGFRRGDSCRRVKPKTWTNGLGSRV